MFNVGSVQGYLKLNTSGWVKGSNIANNSLKKLLITSAALGATMVGSLTLIVKEFGRFDKAIRHATSVSETTSEQFHQMSEMALDASVKWNKAAASTAQAFYFLGSAGLTVTEQMQAFNTTVMLSRAMGSDLAKTTEGLVDIVRAFGLEFADVDRIADQLTKTIISSNQTFEVLDKAMSYAASTAKMTNNTLAQTVAMLGVMANAGIKGSMAGTVLRRAMANLMAPMGKMRKLIYKLGLEIYDTTGKMKPFTEIMGQISDKLRGASDETKNLVYRTLFGVRALAGQIRLFDFGSEAIDRYADAIENAVGITAKVAGKQMAALSEQVGRLFRQIQKLAIIAGEQLAPAVKRVTDKLLTQAKAMEDYIKQNAEAIAKTLKWVAVIGALAIAIPVVVGMASSLLSLINPFTVIIGTLYLLRTVWMDTFKRGGVLNNSLDEFGIVLSKWVDDKLGPLDDILKLLFKVGMMVPKGWAEIWGVGTKLGDAVAGLAGLELPAAEVKFGDVVASGKKAAAELGKMAVDQVKKDIEALGGLVFDVLPATWAEDLTDAMNTFRELIDLIMKEPIKNTMDAATESVKKVNRALKDVTLELVRMSEISIAWATALDEVFEPMAEDMIEWHNRFVDMLTSIQSEWADAFDNLMQKGGSFGDFMDDLWGGILNSFRRMVAEIAAADLAHAIFGGDTVRPGGTPTIMQGISTVLRGFKPPSPPSGVDYQMSPGDISFKKAIPPETKVEIINNGEPMYARKAGQYFDGEKWVIRVVMDAINTDPNVAAAIRG